MWATNWAGSADYGMLKKLFNPSSGSESIYGPIEALDRAIAIINQIDSAIDDDGNFSSGGYSGTRVDITGGVTVPYFTGTEDRVDKLVTINYGNDVTKIAYGLADNKEYVVVHSIQDRTSGEQEEHLVAHAYRDNTTGDYVIKTAMIADKDNSDGAISANPSVSPDDFLLNFYIVGNYINKTFYFTQKTNASIGQVSMGGGSVAEADSGITVRADDEFDTGGAGANDGSDINDIGYFVQLTRNQLLNDTAVVPVQATEANVSGATGDSVSHITRGNSDCLEWTTRYPTSVSDFVTDYTWSP